MALTVPDAPRLLIEADLAPLQGTRLQPTGFPDIGAATYKLPDGTEMLLVESAQSIANRLESVCWDESRGDLVEELAGMPYVRVKRDGKALTSSIQEAHRLNSVYIEKSTGFDRIKQEIGEAEPLDRRRFARALLKLDPNSLVHGTFLESISGTMRLARALSGFIEARDVQIIATGGVKNDRVSAGTETDSEATAKEGFGNVPFHRDEYSARTITAFFSLDLAQLRGYGLGSDAERFLVALSLWKIRRFLDTGLRLRTACDLDLRNVRVTRPEGWSLPELDALETEIRSAIKKLTDAEAFGRPPILDVEFEAKAGKKKSK